MKLGKVVDLLKEWGYPLNSIQFKSPKMRGWYRPIKLSKTEESLACRNLDNGSVFEWRWDTSGGIRYQCEVLKVEIEQIQKDRQKSRIGSDKLVTLYLSDRPL